MSFKHIIILDITTDLNPILRDRDAANYAERAFKDLAFRHVKKIEFQGKLYLMVSNFSKIYLVKIEHKEKPSGKKNLDKHDLEAFEDTFQGSELEQVFDDFMIAYVDCFGSTPQSFDFIKND